MLSAETYVQLDKLSQQNAGLLPPAYWLRGYLLEAPTIGHCLLVRRTERAGREVGEPAVVRCPGVYQSTPVQEISEDADGVVRCKTLNSIWAVTPLPEPA